MSASKVYLPYKSGDIVSGKIEFTVAGKKIQVPFDLIKYLNSKNKSVSDTGKDTILSINVFTCTICNKKFSLDAEYQQHLQTHNHAKDENIAADEISTDSFLKKKRKSVDGKKKNLVGKKATCELCGEAFISKYRLKKHLINTHDYPSVSVNKKYIVTEKQDTISNKLSVKNSFNDVKKYSPKKFTCTVCKKKFSRKSTFQKHVSQHKTTLNESLSISHNQEDISENAKEEARQKKTPLTCKICNSAFTNKYKLSMHELIHVGGKPMPCTLCNKSFSSENKLQAHYKRHQSVKTVCCNVCYKAFSSISDLNQHTLVHGSVRSFVCHICAKAFTNQPSLNKHIDRHSGKKPYTCDICNKSFAETGHLKIHKAIHSDERKHVCEICNKSFKIRSSLLRHCQNHTGERSYTCELCHRSYSNYSSFQSHLLAHTGEKPYVCEICNKAFALRMCLRRHLTVHKTNKPYVCKICVRGYSSQTSFKRHSKTHK